MSSKWTLILGAAIGFCVVQVASAEATLCAQITKFAAGEAKSGGGHVELQRQGTWMVDHSKLCEREPSDPVAIEFCDFLMNHTSTEFMEGTVNEAMACLQGQKIKGYVGNTGIADWEGKVRFFAPQIKVDDIEIKMSWHITAGTGSWDDYLRIEVLRAK